jgi:polyribonucleotide nucleotidyltransferase
VDNVEDVVSVGQKIQVEITKIDDRGKLSLSPVVADEAGAGNSESTDNAEVSADAAE